MRTPLARILLPLALAASAPFARAQVVFEDDFESGLANWVHNPQPGGWHLAEGSIPCWYYRAPPLSGRHYARYGNFQQCLGGIPFDGLMESLPITLPASDGVRQLQLRYHYNFISTDPDWAYQRIRVFANGTPLSVQYNEGNGSNTYMPHYSLWALSRLDLRDFAGADAVLGFEFESIDWFYDGFWSIDDVWVGLVAGRTYCDGIAGTAYLDSDCPCETWSPTWILQNPDGGGCANSTSVRGDLFATGLPSVGADSLRVHASYLPADTQALLVQGTPASTKTTFGDGLLCLNRPHLRVEIVTVPEGTVDFPRAAPPLSVAGGVTAGQTVGYQVVYRDADAGHCPGATWNLTNGVAVTWVP